MSMWFNTPENKGSGKYAGVEVTLEDQPKEKNYVEEIQGKQGVLAQAKRVIWVRWPAGRWHIRVCVDRVPVFIKFSKFTEQT